MSRVITQLLGARAGGPQTPGTITHLDVCDKKCAEEYLAQLLGAAEECLAAGDMETGE